MEYCILLQKILDWTKKYIFENRKTKPVKGI